MAALVVKSAALVHIVVLDCGESFIASQQTLGGCAAFPAPASPTHPADLSHVVRLLENGKISSFIHSPFLRLPVIH